LNNKKESGKFLLKIGTTYLMENNFDKAEEFFKRSEEIFLKINDLENLALFYSKMCDLHFIKKLCSRFWFCKKGYQIILENPKCSENVKMNIFVSLAKSRLITEDQKIFVYIKEISRYVKN